MSITKNNKKTDNSGIEGIQIFWDIIDFIEQVGIENVKVNREEKLE